MLPCVVSAVKSGATSLMRSAGAAGVMVAVLILFLLLILVFRTGPDRWHFESGTNENPPESAGWAGILWLPTRRRASTGATTRRGESSHNDRIRSRCGSVKPPPPGPKLLRV